MDDLRAALAIVQLGRLQAANEARKRLVSSYRSLISSVEGVAMPFGENAQSAHHLAVVVLAPGTDRDRVREAMKERGLQTSVHYPPIHTFSLYRQETARRPLPKTEDVASRLLTLPLFPHMTDEQIALVVDGLAKAIEDGQPRKIRTRAKSGSGRRRSVDSASRGET
jgi:dTDP-4-amino-4,6-dideoxygalactose transaminase